MPKIAGGCFFSTGEKKFKTFSRRLQDRSFSCLQVSVCLEMGCFQVGVGTKIPKGLLIDEDSLIN